MPARPRALGRRRACRLLRQVICLLPAAMPNDTSRPPSRPPSPEQIQAWAAEFDATVEQIHEAIEAVGPEPADIELHLKGSRSSSNSDRVRDAGP